MFLTVPQTNLFVWGTTPAGRPRPSSWPRSQSPPISGKAAASSHGKAPPRQSPRRSAPPARPPRLAHALPRESRLRSLSQFHPPAPEYAQNSARPGSASAARRKSFASSSQPATSPARLAESSPLHRPPAPAPRQSPALPASILSPPPPRRSVIRRRSPEPAPHPHPAAPPQSPAPPFPAPR